jgi:hypothetical protein
MKTLMMRSLFFSALITLLVSCISGKNYFINNATDEVIDIEVHYFNNSQNRKEVFPVPDSLGIVTYSDLAYKPYRFYQQSHRQIPFQKINDSIYRLTLQSQEKTMIPYRYYYDNSLKKMRINQEEEIWFTEVEYGNDSLTGFTTKNTKLGTTVQYEKGILFVGDDSYIIQLR